MLDKGRYRLPDAASRVGYAGLSISSSGSGGSSVSDFRPAALMIFDTFSVTTKGVATHLSICAAAWKSAAITFSSRFWNTSCWLLKPCCFIRRLRSALKTPATSTVNFSTPNAAFLSFALSRLRRCFWLATADVRLSVLLDATDSASDCNVPTSPGAVGVVHAARRVQLDPAHAQRIIAITDDGDSAVIALRACQAYVRAVGP